MTSPYMSTGTGSHPKRISSVHISWLTCTNFLGRRIWPGDLSLMVIGLWGFGPRNDVIGSLGFLGAGCAHPMAYSTALF